MAIESVTTAENIQREEGTDVSISGLFSILNRRNGENTPLFSDLGKLTNVELRTVANQACNVQVALINGLETVGELASSFDPETASFNHLGVGWLVKHLTETLEVALEIKASAGMELAERGYNCSGRPIRPNAREPAEVGATPH